LLTIEGGVKISAIATPQAILRIINDARRHMPVNGYKVFVSHGSNDSWIAAQIAKSVRDSGAHVFLDETDIPKGGNFTKRIHEEIAASNELIALLTPWSAKRSWVWIEIGAAWSREMPVVAVFYGMKVSDLEESGQGKAILEEINILELNSFESYLGELRERVRGSAK
jgi:hypothetical protein